MKTLPTIVASPERGVGIALVEFQGAHPIANRDASGFYYSLQRAPQDPVGRLVVLFSGTVFHIKTDAFGLPAIDDVAERFQVFAEAAIGDSLVEHGIPDHTPSGVSAYQIECFSPHFQAWEDRLPASDDEIEAYIRTHVFWAWRFALEGWELGLSDYLRLHQLRRVVERLVTLGQGRDWTVEARANGFWLRPTPEFLRQNRQSPPPAAPREAVHDDDAMTPTAPAEYVYIDEVRIAELRRSANKQFDLRKLIALCEELNISYRSQCYHAVAALTRTLLDHVPPIFGYRSFGEVANNHAGTRSFKECMQRLEGAARSIGDMHLHTPIRQNESVPTRTQVNFSNEIDVLLSEVVRILGRADPPRSLTSA